MELQKDYTFCELLLSESPYTFKEILLKIARNYGIFCHLRDSGKLDFDDVNQWLKDEDFWKTRIDYFKIPPKTDEVKYSYYEYSQWQNKGIKKEEDYINGLKSQIDKIYATEKEFIDYINNIMKNTPDEIHELLNNIKKTTINADLDTIKNKQHNIAYAQKGLNTLKNCTYDEWVKETKEAENYKAKSAKEELERLNSILKLTEKDNNLIKIFFKAIDIADNELFIKWSTKK